MTTIASSTSFAASSRDSNPRAPSAALPEDDVRAADGAAAPPEERCRILMEAMPQIVCLLWPDGSPEYVNSAWTAYSGLDLEASARAGWSGLVHRDDFAAVRACRRRALKSLAPQHVEVRYRAADGSYHCFLSRLAPIVERGRVVRLVGAAIDIEDRKRAEAALRDSEEQARDSEARARRQLAEIEAIYANAPVGLAIFDQDLHWVRINGHMAEVDGCTSGRAPRKDSARIPAGARRAGGDGAPPGSRDR